MARKTTQSSPFGSLEGKALKRRVLIPQASRWSLALRRSEHNYEHGSDDRADESFWLREHGSVPLCGFRDGFQLGPDDISGTIIDERFGLQELLGQGGFSWVFRAEQFSLRRDVAIKIPRRGGEAAERIRRGGQLLGRIEHEFIATLFDAGQFEHRGIQLPYVAMELVRGAEDIATFCRTHRLGPSERVELFTKVCDAVAVAHSRKVVHRDLKPSNILVNDAGQPRVIDFDIASVRQADFSQISTAGGQTNGRIIGTPSYMSPEQWLGSGVGPESDVFSLGIVLFELLTDQRPSRLDSLEMAIRQHASCYLPRLEQVTGIRISKPFRAICERCLKLSSARRFRDAGEIALQLRKRRFSKAVGAGLVDVRVLPAGGVREMKGGRVWVAILLLFLITIFLTAGGIRRFASRRLPEPGKFRTVDPADLFDLELGPRHDGDEFLTAAVNSWRQRNDDRPLPLEFAFMRRLLAGDPGRVCDWPQTAVELHARGEWIAAGDAFGNLVLAKTDSPEVPRRRLPGNGQPLRLVTFAPDGFVAAADSEGRVAVWSIEGADRGLRRDIHIGGSELISAINFSPDGRLLAVATPSGRIGVWEHRSGRQVQCIDGTKHSLRETVASLCFGKAAELLFVGMSSGTMWEIEVASGRWLEKLRPQGNGPRQLRRSRDGDHLVSFIPEGGLQLTEGRTGNLLRESVGAVTPCLDAVIYLRGVEQTLVTMTGAEGGGSAERAIIFSEVTREGTVFERCRFLTKARRIQIADNGVFVVDFDDGVRVWNDRLQE